MNISSSSLEKVSSNVATDISIKAKWSFAKRVFIFLGILLFAIAVMVGMVNEVIGQKKLSFADSPGYTITIIPIGK